MVEDANRMTQTNPVHSRLKKWLATKFTPNVAVFSSPVARELIKRQAFMSPAEMLRPFGDIGTQNTRTVSTHERSNPYKLTKFRLNFIDSHKIDALPQKDSNMIFDYII